MIAITTLIPGLLIIEPKVIDDKRGFFFESYNKQKFDGLVGRDVNFVQDNHSRSNQNVLRGLHYQIQYPQAKLVRVVRGTVLDVTVDIRRSSPTFGRHVALELSAENKRMLWIPEGLAHGFFVISGVAEFLYKTTDYWHPESERCIRWDDPVLAIDWRTKVAPDISGKDAQGKNLAEAELFA